MSQFPFTYTNLQICLQWLTFIPSVCVLISCPLQSGVISLFIRSPSCSGKSWSIRQSHLKKYGLVRLQKCMLLLWGHTALRVWQKWWGHSL